MKIDSPRDFLVVWGDEISYLYKFGILFQIQNHNTSIKWMISWTTFTYPYQEKISWCPRNIFQNTTSFIIVLLILYF